MGHRLPGEHTTRAFAPTCPLSIGNASVGMNRVKNELSGAKCKNGSRVKVRNNRIRRRAVVGCGGTSLFQLDAFPRWYGKKANKYNNFPRFGNA